jgi:ABC-type uncharacterized transport system fused permease/ATPase subunit
VQSEPIRRFWQAARGFLTGQAGWYPWGLIGLLIAEVVLQLLVRYRLNLWNRDFFNALEQRSGSLAWQQTGTLLILTSLSVGLAIIAVWGRMTFQRMWREWLTSRLVSFWVTRGQDLDRDKTGSEPEFAEYRIAEDARVATDAPIDFMVGLLSAILTAATFVAVLWTVGGTIDLAPLGLAVQVPGFLVLAAILYAAITTTAMLVIGGKMASVIERKNQAESQLKYAVGRLREYLQLPAARKIGPSRQQLLETVDSGTKDVVAEWRHLCGQHVRTTLVSHSNSLLAPLVGLILCVPNYAHGSMMLGEMTQSAAAFVAVQGAFNWLVDNYPRLAEWASSSGRVGVLLLDLDRSEQ